MIAKEFELDGREALKKCFQMAFESAVFSAAVTNSTSSDLFVFEFLIEEEDRNIIQIDHSMRDSSVCCVCIDTNLLNKLPHNLQHAPGHYAPRLALFYISMLEPDFLPELNLTTFEKSVMENVIPLNLELFQSELTDFFNEPEIALLHENVCLHEIDSAEYLKQEGQGEDDEVFHPYGIKLEM